MTVPDPDLLEGNYPVYGGHNAQSSSDEKMNQREVLTDPGSDGITRSLPGIVAGAEVFNHLTGINGEGAGDGTESVSCTGVIALVLK
jgi:hypothetical protein